MRETRIHEVVVCKGPECGEHRCADEIVAAFRRLIEARGLESQVTIDRYCCFGKCQSGPNVLTREAQSGPPPLYLRPGPGARLHLGVSPADVGRILDGLDGAPAAEPAAPSATAAATPAPERRRTSRRSFATPPE